MQKGNVQKARQGEEVTFSDNYFIEGKTNTLKLSAVHNITVWDSAPEWVFETVLPKWNKDIPNAVIVTLESDQFTN